MRRDDGASFIVAVGGYRLEGRAAIRGVFPKFKNGQIYSTSKRPSITVAADRSPAAIAKDIARRFLPEYEPVFAEALAYVTRTDNAQGEAERVATRLADALGARVAGNQSSRYGDGVAIHGEPEAVRRLTVHPAYDHSESHAAPCRVSFEVHDLDPETAAQVLELIDAANKRDASTTRIMIVHPPRTRVSFQDELDRAADEVQAHFATARALTNRG